MTIQQARPEPTFTAPAPGETLAAAKAIRPILMEHRFWADEHARMAPAAKEAAQRARLFKLFAPVELGGCETPLPEMLAIMEELGYSDPTVGWHAGNSSAIGRGMAQLDPEVGREIFARSDGPFGFSGIAGGTATPVEGGFRLTGSWQWVTGAYDLEWVALVGLIAGADGAPPNPKLFIVPKADLIIDDTWSVASAMRGTGSHAVRTQDAFVPSGYVAKVAGKPRIERPMFFLPPLISGPVATSATCIGSARLVLEEVKQLVATKVSRADGLAYRDHPWMQKLIGEASAELDVLSAGLQSTAEEVWRHAQHGTVPPAIRGNLWATSMLVMDRTRKLTSDLAVISTSALYSGRNIVETTIRDMHAMCASMETVRSAVDDYGKVLLGMEPTYPLF